MLSLIVSFPIVLERKGDHGVGVKPISPSNAPQDSRHYDRSINNNAEVSLTFDSHVTVEQE